jgi:hypothetical protein
MTQETAKLKVQVRAAAGSELRMLLKTIGSIRGGGVRLACSLGFDVMLGG